MQTGKKGMKENKRWWCAKARRSPAERPRLAYMRLLIRALLWKHGQERVGNDGCACQQHWTNLLANGQQRQLSRHCFIKATHYKSLIFTQGDSVIEAWSPCAQNFIAAGPAGHWTRRRRVKIDVTFI